MRTRGARAHAPLDVMNEKGQGREGQNLTHAHQQQKPAGAAPRLAWCIDYKTSMITGEDPLRRLLFYWDLGFSQWAPRGIRVRPGGQEVRGKMNENDLSHACPRCLK